MQQSSRDIRGGGDRRAACCYCVALVATVWLRSISGDKAEQIADRSDATKPDVNGGEEQRHTKSPQGKDTPAKWPDTSGAVSGIEKKASDKNVPTAEFPASAPDTSDDRDVDVAIPTFQREIPEGAKVDFLTLDFTKGPHGEPLFEIQGVDVDQRQQTAAGPVQSGRWVAHAFRDVRGIWKHGVETHWDLEAGSACGRILVQRQEARHHEKMGEKRGGSAGSAFKEDKPHGLTTTYHPNGRKKSEFVMVDGLIQGYAVEWDADGKEGAGIRHEGWQARRSLRCLFPIRAEERAGDVQRGATRGRCLRLASE